MEDEEVEKRPKTALTIQGEDFILEQTDPGSFMFDLKLKHVVHGKNGVDRDEFKLDGYGMPLDYAMFKIIIYRTAMGNAANNAETLEMKNFLKQYKAAARSVGKELKQLLKNR